MPGDPALAIFATTRSKASALTHPVAIRSDCYSFTFFGLQRFFFFFATTPQSLQRNSPGFALRIGLSFEHDIVVFLVAGGETPL
jgi:hypothetical protein